MELVALVLLGVVVVAAIGGVVALVRSFLPVSYDRAAQFTERTGVHLTAGNAEYVVDAISRTRRWRVAAVLVTVGCAIAWDVVAGTATFTMATGVAVAAAVLLGTVVGELRNAAVRAPGPRIASLAPRQENRYVGAWARSWPAALAAVSLPLLGIDVVAVEHERWFLLALGPVAVVSWALARWATRFVVDRPRPPGADGSVTAGDDGLRSRALHAIGGTSTLAAGWSVTFLAVLPFVGPTGEQTNTPLAVLAWAVLGWIAWAAWKRGSAPFLVPSPSDAPSPVLGAETESGR